MPTYGYQCTQCQSAFETIQKITDDPLTTCETCGGALRKKIFPVGIAFKGSGFYVNDYASKPGGAADTSSESASAGGESKADAPATPDASGSAPAPAPAPESPSASAPAPAAAADAPAGSAATAA